MWYTIARYRSSTYRLQGVDDLLVRELHAGGVSGLVVHVEAEHLSIDQVDLANTIITHTVIESVRAYKQFSTSVAKPGAQESVNTEQEQMMSAAVTKGADVAYSSRSSGKSSNQRAVDKQAPGGTDIVASKQTPYSVPRVHTLSLRFSPSL